MTSPKISLVVISYNMRRELPRTLFTLMPPYQQNIDPDDIEIIVVDNGSSGPVALHDGSVPVRLLHCPAATQSPAHAINLGLAAARAPLVGLMIDGARMASPGLLDLAIKASRVDPRAVVSSLSYHLGPEVQMLSVLKGYNQSVEDELLASVPWQDNGYDLFRISVPAASSKRGWLLPAKESNALFLSPALWREHGGAEERFQNPGGGLINHDIYFRAVTLPGSVHISLLGEGTFHQFHGGIATNQPQTEAKQKLFQDEYLAIRGHAFRPSKGQPLLFGTVRPEHKDILAKSLDQI